MEQEAAKQAARMAVDSITPSVTGPMDVDHPRGPEVNVSTVCMCVRAYAYVCVVGVKRGFVSCRHLHQYVRMCAWLCSKGNVWLVYCTYIHKNLCMCAWLEAKRNVYVLCCTQVCADVCMGVLQTRCAHPNPEL